MMSLQTMIILIVLLPIPFCSIPLLFQIQVLMVKRCAMNSFTVETELICRQGNFFPRNIYFVTVEVKGHMAE